MLPVRVDPAEPSGAAVDVPAIDRRWVPPGWHTARVSWRVEVHNDDVCSFAVVAHLLHTRCGWSAEDAVRMTREVHTRGRAEVAVAADQDGAEQIAVALQQCGVHAMVRRS